MARVVASAGAVLVLIGFFLPWLEGTREFAARDFSGFDLARLVRNFDIATTDEGGQFRATALALYLVPALAVNGALVGWLPGRLPALTGLIGAAYALFILTAALVLSLVSWTDLQGVLGEPMIGFWVSACGAVLLSVGAALLWVQAVDADT